MKCKGCHMLKVLNKQGFPYCPHCDRIVCNPKACSLCDRLFA